MLLNALWLLVVQAGWLWASVAVIVALVFVLGEAATGWSRSWPATGRVDTVVTDGTLGLYLGRRPAWRSREHHGRAGRGGGAARRAGRARIIAAAVLLVAGGVGAPLATRTAGNVAIGLAIGAGIAWIAVARLTGEPRPR